MLKYLVPLFALVCFTGVAGQNQVIHAPEIPPRQPITIRPRPPRQPPVHRIGDPAVWGLRGQFFYFDGPDNWYSGISEPHMQWNWRLKEFIGKVSGSKQVYVTADAVTFFDDDRALLQKLLVEFLDVSKPSKGCPGGSSDPCLHRGNLQITIGDEAPITYPGEYGLFENAKVFAVNSPIACSALKNKLHEYEEGVAAERRKLSVMDGYDFFEATSDMTNKECAEWFALRRASNDLYKQTGYLTSVIIRTPKIMVRLEIRESAKEGWMWFDDSIVFAESGNEDEIWSGIQGETKQGSFDKNGKEIMKGRKVITGKDADYIVQSPFGVDFAARIV